MSKNRKQMFTIAIALLAVLGATAATADFEGTDEELASELSGQLEEIAFIADSFSKVEKGEKVPVEEALKIFDWLGRAAREIEQRFEAKGDSSNLLEAPCPCAT